MDIFEDCLKNYFKLPYRPEYLYKNIREILKNHNFNLVKESKLVKNKNTYKILFKNIFSEEIDSYEFNNNVAQSKSIENFKNLVYENCKVDIKSIQKSEITAYLFILDEFKFEIIRIIYFAASRVEENIFDKIFATIYYENRNINRNYFDNLFFNNWMSYNIHNVIKTKNKNYDDVFSKENMVINYMKFKYYGPDQTKYYFDINKIGEINKVTLFSPDFLIKKKMKLQYDYDDFQIFNENNNRPDLFGFILDKAILEMNKGIKGEKMNDNIVSDIGIIEFKDKSIGIYLNMVNITEYYESENLKKNLIPKINNNILHLVSSSSVNTESKPSTEDSEPEEKFKKEKFTEQKKFFMEYTAHVHEKQISSIIIKLIGNELLGNGMKRLPRIIFYFNFYIHKSKEEKERITFFLNDKVYGFEEADGVFYLDNAKDEVILNKEDNIPFINIMKFDLSNEINISHEDDKKIIFKNNTLIFIEVKNTFPLKFEKNKNNERKIYGIKDTKLLITNIVKKSIKFTEIALSLEKKIDKIHILFFYDSLLQPSDDIKIFEEEFKKIFKNLKIQLKISTSFDVVYFVNPASINMRKLSNIVIELKEQNKQLTQSMKELEQKFELFMSKSNDITIIQEISDNFFNAKINPKDYELTNVIEKINTEFANRKEIIIDLFNLNDGIICLITQQKVYIIKNNSLLTITENKGKNIFLALYNGNLLLTKEKNILIFEKENFSKYKEITINFYPKQIIQLQYNNNLLFLSIDSNLFEIENYIIKNNLNINTKNIISIIEINNSGEISIIYANGDILFFDLKKNEEIKLLSLQLNNFDFIYSPFIFKNILYLFFSDLLILIDINKKLIIKQIELKIQKIYKFNNNIFAIKNNSIYEVNIDEKKFYLKMLWKEFSLITSLCQIKEKQLLYSTEDGLKLIDYNLKH